MSTRRWLILACGGLSCVLGCNASQNAASRSIVVHGEGTVWTKPDAFVLDVDVSQVDESIEGARRQASETSGKILAAVEPFALDRERSFTTRFTVQPNHVREDDRWVVRGFQASQDLHFHLTDLDQAEDLVIAVLRTGVARISTDFVSREEQQLWPKAREKALLDARARAQQMAAVLGQRVGAPVEIVALDEDTGGSLFGQQQYGMAEDAPPTTFKDRLHWIPPTYVQISATVRVEFALESE